MTSLNLAGCDRREDASSLALQGDALQPLNLTHDASVKVEGRDLEPIRLAVDVDSKTNAHDVSYATTLDVGTASYLRVFPSTGQAAEFDTHPISAQYFHASKLLIVTAGEGDAKTLTYFADPVRWESRPSIDR